MSQELKVATIEVQLSERGLTQLCEHLAELGIISGPSFRDWAQRMQPVMNRLSRQGRQGRGSRTARGRRGGKGGNATRGANGAPSSPLGRKTKAQVSDGRTMSALRKILGVLPEEDQKDCGITADQTWSSLKTDDGKAILLQKGFESRIAFVQGDVSGLNDAEVKAKRKVAIATIIDAADLDTEERKASRRFFPKFAHLKARQGAVSDSDAESVVTVRSMTVQTPLSSPPAKSPMETKQAAKSSVTKKQ